MRSPLDVVKRSRRPRAVRPARSRRRPRRRDEGPPGRRAEQLDALAAEVEESSRLAGRGGVQRPASASPCSTRCATLDEVAYVRFASVYKDFDAAADFQRELELLTQVSSRRRRFS